MSQSVPGPGHRGPFVVLAAYLLVAACAVAWLLTTSSPANDGTNGAEINRLGRRYMHVAMLTCSGSSLVALASLFVFVFRTRNTATLLWTMTTPAVAAICWFLFWYDALGVDV